VTIGAGERALGTARRATGFGVDEDFGRDRAGVVFTTRTGIPRRLTACVHAITETVDANDAELYGAELACSVTSWPPPGSRAR